jgi:hypothetical protein
VTYFVEGLKKDAAAENQVERIGEYAGLEEAIAASRQTIDDFLEKEYCTGMLPAALFARYQAAGRIPFIFKDDGSTINVPFNHLEYAMRAAARLCEDKRKA